MSLYMTGCVKLHVFLYVCVGLYCTPPKSEQMCVLSLSLSLSLSHTHTHTHTQIQKHTHTHTHKCRYEHTRRHKQTTYTCTHIYTDIYSFNCGHQILRNLQVSECRCVARDSHSLSLSRVFSRSLSLSLSVSLSLSLYLSLSLSGCLYIMCM